MSLQAGAVLLAAAEEAEKTGAGPGFHVPDVLHLFTFKPFFTFDLAGIHFEVNFSTFLLFGVTLLIGLFFVAGSMGAKVVPGKLQNLVEAAVDIIRQQVVLPVIGPEGERFLPFLTSMFFFVFGMNILGIIPVAQFPVSSRMAYPAFLALLTYIVFNVVGIAAQGPVSYFKEILFPPGVPKGIYIILTPIEFFSTLVVRPVTLAVRLFANMMAGHVMLAIFFLASYYFLLQGNSWILRAMFPAPFAMSIVLMFFEAFVSVIQAFIFTILTAVYISGALHPAH